MVTRSRAAVRRLAVARLISITGGAAAFMALNFHIYQRTHSATWVAAALFLTFGTTGLASAFTGALGDRFDRQRVMVTSDLASAALFFAMSAVNAPWLLLLFAFFAAVAEAPFFSSSSAAIPNLVDEEDLGWANGMVGLGRNTGVVLGPIIGGLLVSTIGAGAVFALNAVTFVVSAGLVATLRARFNADRDGGEEHKGLRAGFAFLIGDRTLRTITLAELAIVLGLGMTMVADVPLVDLFGAGSTGYGVLIACWGGGAIAGSLIGRFLRPRSEGPAVILALTVVAGTSVVVGFSPWFSLVLGAILAMGVGDGVAMLAEQNIMQRRTPDAVRSRVSGAFDSIVHIGMALSYIVAGPAVAWLGARGVYVVGGGIAFVGVLIALPILRFGNVPAVREAAIPEPTAPAASEPAGTEDATTLLVP
jgi:MFS family permease